MTASTSTADLGAIVDNELPLLYRVARRLTRDPQEAEDLVGQALYNASRAWSSFDGRHPRAWMISILKNEFLAVRRKQGSRPQETSLENMGIAWSGSVFLEVLRSINLETILRIIDEIPEDFRLVFVLCDMEELTYEEAAKALEIPVGTVRSRLFRARRQLQVRLSASIG